MLNPDEDTEWNDALRSKGILPPKQKKEAEISEEQIISMVDQTIEAKSKACATKDISELDLDELDELEDSEDEAVLQEYRQKRIAELKALSKKATFGTVGEISAEDYVNEINKAGEGIWVILHLYEVGIPLCSLVNQFISVLAQKFPQTKFLRSISQTCIPNFPEKNLPSLFIYYEGEMKSQLIGLLDLRADNLTCDELEYLLGRTGAIPTEITENPKTMIKDKMLSDLNEANDW